MNISKSTVLRLALEGYATLQVPQFYVGFGLSKPNDIISVPDDYFCILKADGIPCVGKQSGFLYLTQAGYNYFYEDLKQAYEAACDSGLDRLGTGWAGFVAEAQKHFAKVSAQKQKQIADLQNKLSQLQFFVP